MPKPIISATKIHLRPMSIADYEQVMELWTSCQGIGLSSADSPLAMTRYLTRNPNMSQTVWHKDRLIGAILAGHDGRRGFLHHLAVANDYRLQGLGKLLVESCLTALKIEGIEKVHAFLFADNAEGQAFWTHLGWIVRGDIAVISHIIVERS